MWDFIHNFRNKEGKPFNFILHDKDMTPYLKEIYYGKRPVSYNVDEGVIIFADSKSYELIYSLQVAGGLNSTENFWIALVYCKDNNPTAKQYKKALNIIKAGYNNAPEEAAKILLLRG